MLKIPFQLICLLSFFSFAHANTAIVLVDMQPEFIPEDSRKAKVLLEKQRELLSWGLLNNLALIVFEFDQGGETLEPLKKLIDQYDKKAIVTKYQNGGFYFHHHNRVDPSMLLRSWFIDNLIITGVNGPYCVQETAQGALNNSFNVYTSSDLVANLETGFRRFPDCTWWLVEEDNFYSFRDLDELMASF